MTDLAYDLGCDTERAGKCDGLPQFACTGNMPDCDQFNEEYYICEELVGCGWGPLNT